MEHPNEALIREAYNTFYTGDSAFFKAVTHPDVVFHQVPGTRLSGDWPGMRGGIDLTRFMLELSDNTHKETILELAANEHVAFVLVRHTLTRHGRAFDFKLAQQWRLEDGKLREFWEFPEPAWYEAWA